MKACRYCGRQNNEEALHCSECATPFTVDSPSGGLAPVLVSPLAFLITTGFGILLIALALFFAVGRALAEVGIIPGKPPTESVYSLFTSSMPAPFIALVVIYPVFLFCRARFLKARTFSTAAIVVLLVVFSLLPRVVPASVWLWCAPASLFGGGSSSPFGYYFGAALQSAIGVWLLIWFRPQKSPDEHDTV
jgi:hypothetical protein